MPDDANDGVAKHSFLGCNHQSTCMPSYSLYVQLLWYPMYYPEEMKARVSPVQSIEPHRLEVVMNDTKGFELASVDALDCHACGGYVLTHVCLELP